MLHRYIHTSYIPLQSHPKQKHTRAAHVHTQTQKHTHTNTPIHTHTHTRLRSHSPAHISLCLFSAIKHQALHTNEPLYAFPKKRKQEIKMICISKKKKRQKKN